MTNYGFVYFILTILTILVVAWACSHDSTANATAMPVCPTPVTCAPTPVPTTISTPSPTGEKTYTTKTYVWYSKGIRMQYTHGISDTWSEDHGYMKEGKSTFPASWSARSIVRRTPSSDNDNLAWLVSNQNDHQAISVIAKEITSLRPSGGPQLLIDFVQGMPYITDINGYTGNSEWYQYPVETLYRNSGDCEDKSALLAVMLHESGYTSALIRTKDHVLVGLDKSKSPGIYIDPANLYNNRWVIIETTNTNPIGTYSLFDIPVISKQGIIVTPVP